MRFLATILLPILSLIAPLTTAHREHVFSRPRRTVDNCRVWMRTMGTDIGKDASWRQKCYKHMKNFKPWKEPMKKFDSKEWDDGWRLEEPEDLGPLAQEYCLHESINDERLCYTKPKAQYHEYYDMYDQYDPKSDDLWGFNSEHSRWPEPR